MDFISQQIEAKTEWNDLFNGSIPAIMVGNATCGRSAGASSLLEILNTQLSERNLKCNVLEVGCIGMCYQEPIVSIYVPGKPVVVYGSVKEKDIEKLIESYLVENKVFDQNIIGTIGDASLDNIENHFALPAKLRVLIVQGLKGIRLCNRYIRY